MTVQSVSLTIAGSGGAGVVTAGSLLLDAAARAGWYALMSRSSGPQIRGGEAAAMLRFATEPIMSHDDSFHLLMAIDWDNITRFSAEIPLTAASLIVGDARIGGISGEVEMKAGGAPDKIQLQNAEATLRLELQPKGDAFRFSASGSNWKAPFWQDLVFQTLEAQGELRPTMLILERIDARAYEGLVEGKASLDWGGGATLAGDLDLKRLNAAKLLAGLGSLLSVEGELTARLRVEAKAESLGKLKERVKAEGTFDMKRGVARGFDLGEAVRNTSRNPTRGGETKFEQLTGSFKHDSQDFRLDNVRLSSGLFKAAGQIGVASNGQLNGAVNVELKSSATTLRMPLAVGGTAKDPMLTSLRSR